MLSDKTYDRYQRQLILKGFGAAAQDKLAAAKVLVIGAGGLGCPALQYLVAAGVGHLGIVDNDVVAISNLHRQVLYDHEDIGKPKVEVASQKLTRLNPGISIQTWQVHFGQQQCAELLPLYEIVVDGTDNFASRYLINDACVLWQKPLVFGAVSQFEGQVAVFNSIRKDGTRSVNYRDLFPLPPAAGEVLSCAEAGVLGVLPGVIGTMQATEVIKLITGIGELLTDRLLTYNALTQDFFTMQLESNPAAVDHLPTSVDSFMKMDYEVLCGNKITGIDEISYRELAGRQDLQIVDVRDLHEQPRITEFSCLTIPLKELEWNLDELDGKKVVFICQSGKRSMQAVQVFRGYDPDAEVYYLSGGVNSMPKQE
ncbi:MAG TPA: HesA/MoeB/ThiF family protein [Chitinophagaceae bacterium]|nr:HesA/MoeB/ThiF family protein [Chitinophagaceae bacterium]